LIQDQPHDLEAEAAVIAALMMNNDLIWDAMTRLKPDDFYHVKHRVIYEAIVDTCENGDAKVDIVNLRRNLQGRGELALAGGATGLSEMLDQLPDVSNINAYIDIVKETALSRDAISIGRKLQSAAGKPDDALRAAMMEITNAVSGGEGNPIIDYEDEVELTRKMWEGDEQVAVVETGIPRIDEKMVIMKGNIVVIAGNPGTGKTAFATQVAQKTAKKLPVLFATLEMSPANVTHRIIQSQTGISVPLIMNPRFTTEENRVKLSDVVDREIGENRRTLKMMRPGFITPQDILAAGRAMQVRQGELGLVVVDYLQLMHCPEKGMTSQERVAWLSRHMKAVALQLNVPIFVLSQLSRRNSQENKEPQLHDLRDSGAIEQDADIVLFTHRPNLEENTGAFIVRKQRYGAPFRTMAMFDGRYARFTEYTGGY